MSYPKGNKKKIKTNNQVHKPFELCCWDSVVYSPLNPPSGLARALANNYANEMAAKLASVQPMNDVSVEDLAIVFAVVDQMKKNRESS